MTQVVAHGQVRAGMPVDALSAKARGRDAYRRYCRRMFSLTAAVLLAALFAPLMLLIALGVRCSGKQIIFAHERLGRAGRQFRCLKFRTMRADAEHMLGALLSGDVQAQAEWEKDFKLKTDPRVTGLGAILRKTSLDELPQLFNVVRGDMGLVGPRPIVEQELARYGAYRKSYLSVRPGLTGLWQVCGRSDISYRRRVAIDHFYVRNRSFVLDAKILAKTITKVLGRCNGAY